MFFPFGIVALSLTLPLVLSIDPITTLECHRRQYSYKVQQTDSNGHLCWDQVNVMSCWGRCDSNEIADWKFPYKRSHHPVCMHDTTQEKQVILRNCDHDADPEIRFYKFQEAATCSCSYCKSSQASCEGLRYRGARRAPGNSKKNVKRTQSLNNSEYSNPATDLLKQKLQDKFKTRGLSEQKPPKNFNQIIKNLRDFYDDSKEAKSGENNSNQDFAADLLKVTFYDPENVPSESGPSILQRLLSQLPKRDAEYFEAGGENGQ